MPKGQVSDDELATGLRGFGGIAPFGSAGGRPQRDNPFRDTHSDPVTPAKPEPVKVEVINEPETREPEERKDDGIPAFVSAKTPRPIARRAAVPKVATRSAEPVRTAPSEKPREKKTERYNERVTVLLDAELRDGAESLAKDLQRRRSGKGERITANTIMRVSLRVFLEKLAPTLHDAPNDEEEIFNAVCERVSRIR